MTARSLAAIFYFYLLLHSGSTAIAQPVGGDRSDDAAPVVSLEGRHSLSFGIGLLSSAQVKPGSASATGVLASLSYVYWPHAEWGIEASASLHESDVTAGSAASVSSLLFGASYHPEALAFGSSFRPYLSAAGGPYIGSEAESGFGGSGAGTQTVVGVRLGSGIDVYAWNWLRLGLRAAYHAVPAFDDAVGTIENVSGAQLSVEFGISLGGR
jgi:hypothetical protein